MTAPDSPPSRPRQGWTPGPWEVIGRQGAVYAIGPTGADWGDPKARLVIVGRGLSETLEEDAANARLIALAPEMADALAECVDAMDDEVATRGQTTWKLREHCRALLSRLSVRP